MGRITKKSYCVVTFSAHLWVVIACGGSQNPNTRQADHIANEAMETAADAEKPVVLTEAMKVGKTVYDQYCATCHQANGGGVPNLNPPLKGTDYVVGDKARLIQIVLQGSNVGLEVNGVVYSNAMPPNDFLSDEDVAHVLSYIRSSFGNQADPVSAAEVTAIRASF